MSNRGAPSAPPAGTPTPPSVDSTGEADTTLEDQLLRDAEKEEASTSARHRARAQESSSSALPTPSRIWQGARKAAKKVLGVGKNSASSSSSSAARTLRGQNTVSGVAGTSDSVPAVAATTGIDDEARSDQQPVERTRSEFTAMMRSALAKIQEAAAADTDAQGEAAAADAQGGAAFAEMEQAMTGLMDLFHEKVKPPKLPREFATKWPSSNAEPLHERVMVDPVILASGYSVDKSFKQWFISQKNTFAVTGGHSLSHSLTVPNHLLRDMIATWCLDHSDLPSSITADADTHPSPLMPPSEEQIQDILDMFSGRSELQKEALHLIHLMSKKSKGVHPCLEKCPGLVPVLLDLRKNWKSLWARDAEEERISLFLNLAVHRPNRETLAGQNKLPAVLMKVLEKADRFGISVSSLAMVASTVAMLSEFDVFRKRLLATGGMKMLSELLKIDDVVVRKETATAILALCTDTDEEAKSSAVDHDVPDMLLECFMATDEFLLLLDRLPKSPYVLDRICDHAVELVNIVIEEHGSEMVVTTQGINSAISLIFLIAQRDVRKLKVKNVEVFMERLQELSSKRLRMQTMFQVEEIIKTLSPMFPAPTRQLQNQ